MVLFFRSNLIFLFLIALGQLFANDGIINGKVVDQESGEALPNVNIFISGTTWGTTSGLDGKFSLKNIKNGQHELVASMIGYESVQKIINLKENETLEINIEMRVKIYRVDQVEVKSTAPSEWESDLKKFKRYFLGRSKFADDCIIEDVQYFEFTKPKPHLLVASIERPFKIINKALGYELICELKEFSFNDVEQRVKYLLLPRFIEMTANDENIQDEWRSNRVKAYEGSLDHFLQSLVKGNFGKHGYEIETSRIASQSGFDGYRNPVFAADSILNFNEETKNYTLHFDHYLQIKDTRRRIDGLPISWVKLLFGEAVLDSLGYATEVMSIETHGYWSTRGVADLLPKYYSPND